MLLQVIFYNLIYYTKKKWNRKTELGFNPEEKAPLGLKHWALD
jgi:hypothetical protein